MFGVKEPIPGGLRSRVVYKFTCAGCNACYVGETVRLFSTRVKGHLASDSASHIFQHVQNSEHCRALCSADCFHVLDHASTSFQLKIKETIHIQREQPPLNQQLQRINLQLSLKFSHFQLCFILLLLLIILAFSMSRMLSKPSHMIYLRCQFC